MTGYGLEYDRRHHARCRIGEYDTHVGPFVAKSPDDVGALVCGDAAGDAQQDVLAGEAGHGFHSFRVR